MNGLAGTRHQAPPATNKIMVCWDGVLWSSATDDSAGNKCSHVRGKKFLLKIRQEKSYSPKIETPVLIMKSADIARKDKSPVGLLCAPFAPK